MISRALLAAPILVLLAGCPSSVRNVIAENEAALTAGDATILAYVQLPPCGTPSAPKVCSDRGVVIKLNAARQAAFVAVKAAESAAKDPAASGDTIQKAELAAATALGALQGTIATLPK